MIILYVHKKLENEIIKKIIEYLEYINFLNF